jgi:hypothetical protein
MSKRRRRRTRIKEQKQQEKKRGGNRNQLCIMVDATAQIRPQSVLRTYSGEALGRYYSRYWNPQSVHNIMITVFDIIPSLVQP